MSADSREQRQADLRAIGAADSAQIIDTYKGIMGIPSDGPLPPEITFEAMIAAIRPVVEHEAKHD